jgi:hypothetical protein
VIADVAIRKGNRAQALSLPASQSVWSVAHALPAFNDCEETSPLGSCIVPLDASAPAKALLDLGFSGRSMGWSQERRLPDWVTAQSAYTVVGPG